MRVHTKLEMSIGERLHWDWRWERIGSERIGSGIGAESGPLLGGQVGMRCISLQLRAEARIGIHGSWYRITGSWSAVLAKMAAIERFTVAIDL